MLSRLLAQGSAHLLQLGSEVFIDEQVDEEVGQVVDVERETKIAADWFKRNDGVYERCVQQNKDEEQTQTDFHCFHVARPDARVLPAKYSLMLKWFYEKSNT